MWPVWPVSASCFSWFVLMSSYGLSLPAVLFTAAGTRNSIKNSLWKLITEKREDISLERSFLHVLVWLRYFDKFNPLITFFPKSLWRTSYWFSSLLARCFPHFPLRSLSFLSMSPSLPLSSTYLTLDLWCDAHACIRPRRASVKAFPFHFCVLRELNTHWSTPIQAASQLMLKESLCFSPKAKHRVFTECCCQLGCLDCLLTHSLHLQTPEETIESALPTAEHNHWT